MSAEAENAKKYLKLEISRKKICESLTPSECCGIVSELQRTILDSGEYIKFVSYLPQEQPNELIKLLLKSSNEPGWYRAMCDAFEYRDCEHVVNILEGSKLIQEVYLLKDILQIFSRNFVEKLEPEDILPISNFVNCHTRQLILSKPTQMARAQALIDYLIQKPHKILDFVHALQDNERYSHLVEDLLGPSKPGNTEVISCIENMQSFFPCTTFSTENTFFKVLTLFFDRMVEIVEPKDLLEGLDCFSDQTRKYIAGLEPREARVVVFIQVLSNYGLTWFKPFIIVLKDHTNICYNDLSRELEALFTSEEDDELEKKPEVDLTHQVDDEFLCEVEYQPARLMPPCRRTRTFFVENIKHSATIGLQLDSNTEVKEIVGNNHMACSDDLAESVYNQSMRTSPSSIADDLQTNWSSDDDSSESFNSTEYTESLSSAESNINLRKYQEELLRDAWEGHNSIVVAPTGSGKTRIAAKLCEKKLKIDPNKKVFVVVPTTGLATQHCEAFKGLMPEDIKLKEITGEKSKRLPHIYAIRPNNVIFITAKILENLLSEKTYKLSGHVSLMVIDECHHTSGKHAYNKVMQYYHQERRENTSDLPQILGLTATPAICQANSISKARNTILEWMANLDVQRAPSQVILNQNELRHHLPNRDSDVVTCKNKSNSKFNKKMESVMEFVQDLLLKEIRQYPENFTEKMRNRGPKKGTQEYDSWLQTIFEAAKAVPDCSIRSITNCQKYLETCNNAMIININIETTDAWKYVKDEKVLETNDRRLSTLLVPTENFENEDNPLLIRLTDELNSAFGENALQSRCIIFVKTKHIAKRLAEYINRQPGLKHVNARAVTGNATSSKVGGMTKVEQKNAMDDFRSGRTKVITATSVVEEGIDVPSCNLVISYNLSTSEVAKVQREGRARAGKSRSILLTYEDSELIERDQNNDGKIQMIEDLLEDLRNTPPAEIKKEVKQFLRLNKLPRQPVKPILTAEKYKFVCHCLVEVTTSENIRRIKDKHYIVADDGFKSLIKIFKRTTHSDYQGALQCKNCGHSWGETMKYKSSILPSLKISQFYLVNDQRRRKTFSDWSKNGIPVFPVKQLEPEDCHIADLHSYLSHT